MVSGHRAGCRYAPRGCDTWFKTHGRSGDTAALEDQPGCSRRVRRTAARQPLAHTPSIHPSRISPTATSLAWDSANTETMAICPTQQNPEHTDAVVVKRASHFDTMLLSAVFLNTSDDPRMRQLPLESQRRHCTRPCPPSPDTHAPWRAGRQPGLAWRLVFVTAPRARPTSRRAESFNCQPTPCRLKATDKYIMYNRTLPTYPM